MQRREYRIGVAVSAAAISFDQLFTYLSAVPIAPGCRVVVPFGRSNSRRVGMVLEIAPNQEDQPGLKPILSVLDETPLLNQELIDLVFWLKEMTFCTYYDAVKTILPAGMQLQFYQTLTLAKKLPALDSLSEPERNLLGFLQQAKTQKEFQRLLTEYGTDHEKAALVEQLQQKGVLLVKNCTKEKVQDAATKMIRLGKDWQLHTKSVRMTPKQKRLVQLLEEMDAVSEKEACYLCSMTAAVIRSAQRAGLVECYAEPCFREAYTQQEVSRDPSSIVLSPQQQAVYEVVAAQIAQEKPQCFLLHGVTGSGKTSVFQKLIHTTIQQGKQVILLVPEIALTPQIVGQFHSLFGNAISVVHSALSLGQRKDAYRKIQSGQAKIVIGTRSAIFAPVQMLGLIIVDEEGERSYKSDSAPRYHAIEVAKKRCRTHNCTLLLASATPSIESYYYAEKQAYTLLELKQRYGNAPLPQVEMIDMNLERQAGNSSEFSTALVEALRETLARREQAILLLNRRGYHTIISCTACNQPVYCPNCSVPMTYHKVNDSLMCHYCGHTQPMVTVCPVCGNTHLRQMGFGTQRLEEELQELVPDARILRMDADTTMSRYAYEKNFTAFGNGEYDIMVGTQMIGKGLDFPNVTLVGVLSVDKALFSGDFRSYERTFSLITQVVGRGGRGGKPGRAFLQTFQPEHYVLQLAAQQNYKEFYEQEIAMRRALVFPPICDICTIGFTGTKETAVAEAAERTAQCVQDVIQRTGFRKPLWMLGPTACTYGKLNGKYRYRLLLKCKNTVEYRDLIRTVLREAYASGCCGKVHIYADMNGDIGI